MWYLLLVPGRVAFSLCRGNDFPKWHKIPNVCPVLFFSFPSKPGRKTVIISLRCWQSKAGACRNPGRSVTSRSDSAAGAWCVVLMEEAERDLVGKFREYGKMDRGLWV